MSDINRRDALKLMGLMAAASTFGFSCTSEELDGARQRAMAADTSGVTQPGPDYTVDFFTEHEFETVRTLADLIIPADERSGSASDARVPEFIDFIMTDELIRGLQERQTAMRGGLAWLDYECLQRYDQLFVGCSEAQRTELIDLVAWPEQAPPELHHGVAFFNSFRNMTASGFFSSKMGMEDLQYIGNTSLAEWTGCPDEVLRHVGVLQSTKAPADTIQADAA